MNKQIEFRGKRLDNGEWVYGYYVKYGFTGREKHYIVPSYASDLYAIEVDPSTVGQFTGLVDKNKTKIYEGDVVRFTNYIDDIYYEETGICVFEQEECNFCLQRKEINPENYPVPTTIHTIYLISNITYKDDVCYEVIDNIFDKEKSNEN